MEILIAEDDPVSRRVLEDYLKKWGYSLVSTRDGAEAWEALSKEGAPQMAILDWMMPGMDGLEVCRRVRQRGAEPYVYILLLTVRDQNQDVIEGMEAGADDYITKPYDAGELRARLRAGRRILALQEALISARDALRFQATHDPLTGLWNRLATVDILRRELARSARAESSVGLVMADLDGFKKVNDIYGHMAGDAALREASHRMLHTVRVYDTVGRYGGEEFLMVLPGCDKEGALGHAERLRAAFQKPFDLPDASVSVTLSLGVVAISTAKDIDAGSLIRAADQALYRAKDQGRNRAVAASEAELAEVTQGKASGRTLRHKRRNGGQ